MKFSGRRLAVGYVVLVVAFAIVVTGSLAAGSAKHAPAAASQASAAVAASGCTVHALTAETAFGRLMLAIAVVILAAWGMGSLMSKIGQPKVMGEVLAGILLGPSLLGALAPCVAGFIFPPALVPPGAPTGPLTAAADIGLAFYMFLVGLELDPGMLRGRVAQSAFISNASVLIPLGLGMAAAVPLYERLAGSSHNSFPAFALFMGVAMAITAFPVLARILLERRMIRHPVGAMALASAAVDDVTAWCLLALAGGIAVSGGVGGAVRVIVLAVAFCAALGLIGRRLLSRVSTVFDEAGHIPGAWIAAIFVGILLSAYVATVIGIAAIFGAFVVGLIMPRRADLTHDITRRVETFVSVVLLPLFFVVTGLRTRVGTLNSPGLWLICAGLIGVAVIGKFLGASLAARYTGLPWRESAAIGALMNTRGLTELIVLNVGLELHVITPALFTMLVIMALVTTFMTGPALRLIDPRRLLTEPATSRAAGTAAGETRAILVAPQDERNIDSLLAIAEPLARTDPPREIILAGLVRPSSVTSFISVDDRHLSEVNADVQKRREALRESGLKVRAVAFLSAHRGADTVRLASEQEVDLVLLDGSRPITGDVVPRGAVGEVLREAPGDVAVLIQRFGRAPELGPEAPVLVPFGGAEHDWAALELGSWLAAWSRAPLRMLGSAGASGASAGEGEGEGGASRMIADTSLIVQKLTGVAAEPVMIEPGSEGILKAAEGAGLLVVGLSDRWRTEGIGEVRSQIVTESGVPVLLVRSGTRPGALSPKTAATRFAWSTVGPTRAAGPSLDLPPDHAEG